MKFARFAFVIMMILLIFDRPISVSASSADAVRSFPLPDEHAIVYDENGNGSPDLLGDTWVFDTDQKGTADLIVQFRRTPALTAFVYDDINGNGRVDYAIDDAGVQVLEPGWRLSVSAEDDSWSIPGGLPYWNLDLHVKSNYAITGDTPAIPRKNGCSKTPSTVTGIRLLQQPASSPTASEPPEFEIRYWDLNKDGVPDYEWHSVQGAGPFDLLVVNKDPSLTYQPTHRFPLLDTVLLIDWTKGRIDAIRSLIPDQGNQASYVLSFDHQVTPGSVSAAVQDPVAYYALQGNSACAADLKIQAVSLDHDQIRGDVAAYNQIRYNWSQNSGGAQYRLFLLGQVFVNSVKNYPLFSVPHVGYENLAAFVLDNNWLGASFAELENPVRSTQLKELPENSFYISALNSTLVGRQDVKLPDRYLPVFELLREEYDFKDYDRTPRLYFSSIDRRLHLVGAQGGIIIFSADTSNALAGFDFSRESLQSGNLSIQSATSYSDTDGDGYVDTWIYQENQQPVVALVVRPGVALLAEANSLQVKQLPADFNSQAWEVRPPASSDEWKTLGGALAADGQARRALNDLPDIFKDLPGNTTLLEGTSLRSVSSNAHILAADIVTAGLAGIGKSPIAVPASGVQAGEYVLRNTQNGLSVEAVSNAQLALTPLIIVNTKSGPDGTVGLLSFSIQDPGNLDIKARLRVWDKGSSGQTLLRDQNVVIPAFGKLDMSLFWTPSIGGLHQLVAQVDYGLKPDGSSLQVSDELDQDVTLPDPSAALLFLLTPADLPASIFLLFTLAVILLGGTWVVLHGLEDHDGYLS